MPDLADLISRAAVAALDLAPFDDRFGRLSRQVLAGGASRFARVVDPNLPVRYVIPVGVTGERIEYGALVLQPGRAGLLWRDASGTDHARTVALDAAAPGRYDELTLGGEPWQRFEVGEGEDRLGFLVPPVSSPRLRSTLIDHLNAQPADFAPGPVGEPDPEPAAVRFPDPEPEPEPEPDPEPEPEALPDPDGAPTALLDPIDAPQPEVTPPFEAAPGPENAATRVHEPFDLFRDDHRQPGPAPLEAAVVEPRLADPAPLPSADVRPVEAAPVYAPEAASSSATVRGFLIGLFVVLVVGSVILAWRFLL